ncbi:MAG: 2'-5' RNA ligase family protein [bacterium]|nr:2'-5' RNA ligase family protein [bacterium]
MEIENLIAVISILEGEYYDCIRDLWEKLNKKFGLYKVCVFKHPHMTFQGGIPKNGINTKNIFNDYFKNEKPFMIKVNNVKKFGNRVIYLSIEKTKRLSELNKKSNKFMKSICTNVVDLYEPDKWIPHITLALDDIPEKKFKEIFSYIKSKDIRFRLTARNLSLVKSKNLNDLKILRTISLVPGTKKQL